MKRSETRILTTHVGSIPRPEDLLRLGAWRSGPPRSLAELVAQGARLASDELWGKKAAA